MGDMEGSPRYSHFEVKQGKAGLFSRPLTGVARENSLHKI